MRVRDPRRDKLRDFRSHGYDRYDLRDPWFKHKLLLRHSGRRVLLHERRAEDRLRAIFDDVSAGGDGSPVVRTRGPKRSRRTVTPAEQKAFFVAKLRRQGCDDTTLRFCGLLENAA